jgi:hypothetical protein
MELVLDGGENKGFKQGGETGATPKAVPVPLELALKKNKING